MMDSDTAKLFEKLDKMFAEIYDLKVQSVKLSITQDFIVENQKQRAVSDQDIDDRLSALERKINYAAGIIAVGALFLSAASQWLWKKVSGA